MAELESPDNGRQLGLCGVVVGVVVDVVDDDEDDDDEELDEEPGSLRIGLVRFIDGGGFRRSVTPGEVSGFFSLPLPVELLSNTISGLFLPRSLVELWQTKAQEKMFLKMNYTKLM